MLDRILMSDRPFRVLVRVPGGSQLVELADGKATIVGRSPDWSRLGESGDDTVVVPSPSVSGNHLRLRREGERLFITDLGSRNGTLVELPPKRELAVALEMEEVAIHLASGVERAAINDAPLDAKWTGRSDYVSGVCEAIGVWLEARELRGRATIVPRDGKQTDVLGRMPLATGEDLVLEPDGTPGLEWPTALLSIERWLFAQNLRFETEESMRAEGLVVASAAMRKAIGRVVAAATSGARVLLITGPSGAGKEGLARCFHRHTGRAGPFIARNCAMFSKDLVRSELFGAEKGAFTGSVARIVGAVEMASEGTLFLDEIGELPREIQPMLLRFLDLGEYERLGSYGHPKIADVRIVAATNRDLRAAALSDEFRTDLWFRLSVHVVEVPPLRDRPEDVIAYLKLQRSSSGTTLFDALAPATIEVLLAHAWDGNFRELANFAERSLPLVSNRQLSPETAAALLREGSLAPPKRAQAIRHEETDDEGALLQAVRTARAAFVEDSDGELPRTWDQIKTFVESYLKPLLFAELSGSVDVEGIENVDLRTAADRVGADRGTALKQLRRYFDRFSEP